MDQPPVEVRIWFTQEIEPAFSTVKVLDAEGHEVDRHDTQVDPRDATLLHVSLGALGPGKYRVIWRVVSVDTHVSEGDYEFQVGR